MISRCDIANGSNRLFAFKCRRCRCFCFGYPIPNKNIHGASFFLNILSVSWLLLPLYTCWVVTRGRTAMELLNGLYETNLAGKLAALVRFFSVYFYYVCSKSIYTIVFKYRTPMVSFLYAACILFVSFSAFCLVFLFQAVVEPMFNRSNPTKNLLIFWMRFNATLDYLWLVRRTAAVFLLYSVRSITHMVTSTINN